MLRLPLKVDDKIWRLPLTDATALSLADALLSENSDERRARLAELAENDPVLSLWAVCQAYLLESIELDGESIVDWLERRAVDELEFENKNVADDEQLTVWRQLYGASIVAAEASEDRFFGLISLAPEWLSSCGPDVSIDDDVLKSIAASIEKLRKNSPQSNTETDAADEWLAEIPQASTILPAVISQMRQRRDLQADYSATLEREKLDSLKELAYGAGHEINNPLANISTRAQTLLQDERDPERRRKLATIYSQAFRAHEMIADLMLFARPPQLNPKPVDLVALVDSIISELTDDAQTQNTVLCRSQDSDKCTVKADPVHLSVALRALCINALQAIGTGGRVECSVKASDGQCAEISVADTGPGIAADARRHIFDPFYSGREAGRGLGFGLSRCWSIVQLHGGHVVVDSQPGAGATFTIRLPEKLESRL